MSGSDELVDELRRSLGRMEIALGLMPDAVVWADRTGRVRWCNTALDHILGRPHIEILGADLVRLLPLDDGEHPVSRAGRGERRGEGRYSYRSRVLEIQWESARSGEEDVHVFLLRDLTENHRHLEELERLKRAEARFRMAVEAAPNAMIMVDRAGKIVLVNSQVERMFGYAREELLDRKIDMLVPERFRAAHPGQRGGFHAAPRVRAMGAGRDLHALRKDGSEVPVEIGLNPIESSEGLVLASIIDITQRKRIEEQAKEAARLDAAQKELEAFSYSVAHDLRAPLRHIDGFIQMLAKNAAGKLDDRGRDLMEKIGRAAKKMGALIDELLAFSKTARLDLRPETVSLRALVDEVIADLKEGLGERAVEWRVAGLPDAVCDAGMMRLVFANLIGNALKFSRDRSPAIIEIGPVEAASNELVIRVRDNGVGFDMRFADKLFGVFQRLHRMEEFEGTGIGLANVRRIVAKHGGRTWAEGEVGKGASFYFSLPAPKKEAAP
ncbi:MAG: PAS domain S-box protein [Elusimicrobia bacterium]|nr:PAS domain S-box protein [Elusimicrobiota bacterium]